MEFKDFVAGKDDDNRRLDRIVRAFLPQENLSKLYKSIRNGFIKVNNKTVKQDYRVLQGDKISVAEVLLSKNSDIEIQKKENKKTNFEFFEGKNVVFKNEHIIAINKPYDVNVQDELAKQIALKWHKEKKDSVSFTPGPLHRLDRKTTGTLIFSQSLQGAKWFSNAFATHSVKKTYLAILQGKLQKEVIWKDFIEKNDNSVNFYTVKVFSTKTNNSKESVTIAKPISYGVYKGESVTLSKIVIETGRTHQIRSQSAFHGFHLLGDTAYGGKKIYEKQDFFLHAYKIEVLEDNPLNIPKEIVSEIPETFKQMLDKTLIKLKSPFII